MKNLIAVISFILFVNDCVAQKEWNIWYFGTNAGMDFNSGAPIALHNGIINTSEGCASISDSAGSLLFYTDGITVRNSNHTVMPNGTGLTGNSTSTHSAIILQKPGSPGIYYIFTTYDDFCYSIVDMSLNNGLGDVTVKNHIIMANVNTEKQCITRHANGVDIWVVLYMVGISHSFLFTSTGLSPVAVTSLVSSMYGAGPGQIKISPAGNKIAFGFYHSTLGSDVINVFDFDNNTGIVSGGLYLTNGAIQCYGLEFSPDGTKLYATAIYIGGNATEHKLHQFDLTAGSDSAIQASLTELAGITSPIQVFVGMQLAPDFKIYVCKTSSTYINVINDPNQSGIACNYQDSVLNLAPGAVHFGLPPVLSSEFYLTSVNEIDDNTIHVSVYPNPTSDFIYISNPNKEQLFDVALFDMNGRKILESFNNLSQVRMDLGKLPNAVYLLEILTDSYHLQLKLIKI